MSSILKPQYGVQVQRKYTGKRGKPVFDINEELNFLLEQGFMVGEISHMLRVGKRMLERRMHSFGLSVMGK